jgi:hypothetical protein
MAPNVNGEASSEVGAAHSRVVGGSAHILAGRFGWPRRGNREHADKTAGAPPNPQPLAKALSRGEWISAW